MKRHHLGEDEHENETVARLCRAMQSLQDADEFERFLRDLCTPAELEAMADRWRVVECLAEGRPYREIHDRTGVSVTTVGRVARFLEHGHGGYRLALGRTRTSERRGAS